MFPQVPDPTAPPYMPHAAPMAFAAPAGAPVFEAATMGGLVDGPVDGCVAPGPEAVLAELVTGNTRFVTGAARFGHSVAAAVAAVDRRPSAVVVGCMDARVPVEAVFDQDVGTLCAVRTAGHVLDQAALASVEVAVDALGVRLVVVLGHSRCAAVTATVTAARTGEMPPGNLGYVVREIMSTVPAGQDAEDTTDVTRRHTGRVAVRLRGLFDGRGVRVAGGVYDVRTGRVEFLP